MITSEALQKFLTACERTYNETEAHFVDISNRAYAEWALTELSNRVFDVCAMPEWAESYLVEDIVDAFAWEMQRALMRCPTESQRLIFTTAVYTARRLESNYNAD